MKKHKYTTEELFERLTYQIMGGSFIFYEDIHKIIGKRKMKKFDKMSAGSTCLLITIGDRHHSGIYPGDVRKFMKLDALGK